MPYNMTPDEERAMREYFLGMNPQTDPMAMGGMYLEPGSMPGSEVKNYNQILSDPAFLAQLGDGPGGLRREAFDPITSYEQVRQPGREMLNYAMQSGDPIYRLMAEVIINEGSSLEAEQVIRDVLADPENPWFEGVSARMPQYQDQVTGDFLPDWRRLSTISQSLMEDSISDPMGDMIDPNTGMPMNVSEEMSPAAEYFRRAGLPLPTERYGMEQWRGMDELAAFEENQQLLPQARQDMERDQGQFERARERMLAMQLMIPPPPGNGKAVASQGLLPSGGALGAGSPGPAGSSRPFPMESDYQPDLTGEMLNHLRPGESPAPGGIPWGGESDYQPGLTGEMLFPMQSEDPFDVASRAMADQLDQGMGMGGSFGLEREDRAYSADGHRGGPRAAPSRGAPQPSGTRSQMDLMRQARLAGQKQKVRQAAQSKNDAWHLSNEMKYGFGRGDPGRSLLGDQMRQRAIDESGRTPLKDTVAARREALMRFGLGFGT